MTKCQFAAAALSLIAAAPALAQTANPCPNGQPGTIRTSTIKPGGTMEGFMKAFADHAKWYAGHGYHDVFTSATVIERDPTTKAMTVAPNTVMTFHLNATDVPHEKHDAAWDAYVKEYTANSQIVSTTMICMAK